MALLSLNCQVGSQLQWCNTDHVTAVTTHLSHLSSEV